MKPDISINGQVVESVSAYEALLDAQGKRVSYTIASFDAQPVSPNYALGCPEPLSLSGPGAGKAAKSIRDGDRVSFAVQVNGTILYGKGEDVPAAAAAAAGGAAEQQTQQEEETAFNEAWLLVPHWEALGRNAPRGLRRWVVVSQNFRAF